MVYGARVVLMAIPNWSSSGHVRRSNDAFIIITTKSVSSGHSVSHMDQHLLPMVLQTVHISLQNPNLEPNTNDHLLQTFGDRRRDRMVVEGVVVVVVAHVFCVCLQHYYLIGSFIMVHHSDPTVI